MLETDRLSLLTWRTEDAEDLYALSRDEGFGRFPITDWRQESIAAARAWIDRNNRALAESGRGVFAIREKAGGALIGIAALRLLQLENENRHEITYRLRSSAWGKGYATEAAMALLAYGFGPLALQEIAASITPDNAPSLKVIRKLGFEKTGSELMNGIPAEIFRLHRSSF